MSKPDPTRYRATKWSDYGDALRMRGSLLIWLQEDMIWLAPLERRPQFFSNAEIRFCLSLKVPLRQTTRMVASLFKMAGLDWEVLHYTTRCRLQKTLGVQIPYGRADGA